MRGWRSAFAFGSLWPMKTKVVLRWMLVALLIHTLTLSAAAQMQWGRNLEGRRTTLIAIGGGAVFDIDGEVQETTRPIEVVGGPTSGAPPEDYSWRELGFDQNFPTFGLTFEKMGHFMTLQSQFIMGSPTVSSVADRDYYIGVSSVTFDGVDYEYMVIPEGESFSGEIDLYALDLRTLFTPVSFGTPDTMTFTPWIHIGLYMFLADYEVDAGPARGVTQYENPPRDYVIGGRGSGRSGLIVPELGLGGEWGISLGERSAFYLQGYFAFLKLSTRTSLFGVQSRNEKNVSVDYQTIGARALLEIEIGQRADLVAGVEVKYMTGDAEVRAIDRDEEEILARREKFDKDVHFDLSNVLLFVGVRF